MAGIKGKDTKPEIVVRKLLHKFGYRFRLHKKELPGNPDIVLPKYKTVIFVHGCFWHGHEDCHLFRLPKTRKDFWKDKIESNKHRDAQAIEKLLGMGFRVIEFWECALKGKSSLEVDELSASLKSFISGNDTPFTSVRGKSDGV